jgi:xanthine dehydrogenase accessory factor
MAGFRTVVVDDRTLFANRERFPAAHQVVCGPILDVCREIELSPHHYFVLVTRGHVLDMDALRVLIDRREPVAYLGMIGSKRRVSAVFELLEQEGYARELFRHVYAPIGLNIGAETPAEIAVSVMAEIIAVRRQVRDDTTSLVRLTGLHPSLRRARLKPVG